MPYLLDTSAAIVLRDDAATFGDRFAALTARPAIAAITRVELEGGVHVRAADARVRRQRLDALLRRFQVLDFSDAMAAIYGDIVRRAGFSRRKIIDRMIAATAIAQELTLITLNGGGFAGIDGLDLEIWHD